MRRQGAINLAGALVKSAAAIVATPLTLMFCGLEEFGRWAFLISVATVVATTDFGLPTTVTVYMSHKSDTGSSLAMSVRATYIGVASLVVALLMGGIAAGVVFAGPHLSVMQKFFVAGSVDVRLAVSMGLFVGTRILANVTAAFLQAETNYRAFVMIGLTFVLPTAVGMPLAARFGFDARAFLHLHTFFSIVNLFAYLAAVGQIGRRYGWRFAVDWHEWSGMTRFGFGSWLGAAGGILFSQLDRVLVGILLSTHQLGIYAASTQIASQINALSAIPVQPLLPYVSKFAHNITFHLRELQSLLSEAIRMNTAVALGLSGIVVILAPTVAAILVETPDAEVVTSTLRILGIVYGGYSLNAVGFYSLFATHDVKRLCVITVGSGILTLATVAAGAQLGGLIGAAIGNVSFVATLALTIVALRRFGMSITLWLRMVALPLTAWGLVVGFTLVLHIENTIATLISATLLSFVLIAWLFARSLAGHLSVALAKNASASRWT
jgi:O-antigen/teichoic acid export membrane protein